MSTPRLLLSLAASLALASLSFANEQPTLEQRLEKLAETLEAAREEAHIPGMSIAIVKGDEVVWARGFGLADVAAGKPADENTIYAIGSSTKAFTATLVGMLADEGKASFDDPVTAYLPYLDLAVRSDDENAECTLRDLLSHRSGFSRMPILCFNGGITREEVLRTAAGAEPLDDFRAGFHYSNVMYLAAGEAAGVADGSSWDELMVERVFDPLEMTSSTVSATEAQKDPRLALGYSWDEEAEQHEHERMMDIGTIGPAGSVNSNVIDMARWLRLQLGRGAIDGMRLISTERLLETWEPQIEIGDGVSYGLGWMLREHDGRRVVEHGGNIDGFSAQVGFLPEEHLGYVLLMNLDVSPLQQASLPLVFDALLDEWPDESAVMEAGLVDGDLDLEAYVGVYVANFATFRDAEFQVVNNDGRLRLEIPGQQPSDLEPPDAEGRWTTAVSEQVAVSFQRDGSGAIVGLTVHQGSFDFEVPRKGVELQPEVPLEELEKYVGTYIRAKGGKRVQLEIEGGRLTMNDNGKRLPFHTPDAEGHATLRFRADWGATFALDAEGNVESFVFRGAAGDRLFTRAPLDGELPTLDEVLARRETDARAGAIEARGDTRITGSVWIAQAGVRGFVTRYSKGGDRYASHMDFGKFGRVDAVMKGDEAWRYTSMRGFETLTGSELAQALLEHPGVIDGDWTEYFDSVEVVRSDSLDDRPVHVLRLVKDGLPSRTYWVDAEHGDVLRVNLTAIERRVRVPMTITRHDFEELDGIRRPMRVEIENPMSGRLVMTFEQVESGLELDDDVFTLEESDAMARAKD